MSNPTDVLTEKQSLSTTNIMDVDIFSGQVRSNEKYIFKFNNYLIQILEQTSEFTTFTNVDFDDDSQSDIVDYILKESLPNG